MLSRTGEITNCAAFKTCSSSAVNSGAESIKSKSYFSGISAIKVANESVAVCGRRSKRSVQLITFSRVRSWPSLKVSAPDESKSITKAFLPNSAQATANAWVKVVLPTPPAKLANTTIGVLMLR